MLHLLLAPDALHHPQVWCRCRIINYSNYTFSPSGTWFTRRISYNSLQINHSPVSGRFLKVHLKYYSSSTKPLVLHQLNVDGSRRTQHSWTRDTKIEVFTEIICELKVASPSLRLDHRICSATVLRAGEALHRLRMRETRTTTEGSAGSFVGDPLMTI